MKRDNNAFKSGGFGWCFDVQYKATNKISLLFSNFNFLNCDP